MIGSPKELELREIPVRLACDYNKLWHRTLPDLHWANPIRSKKHIFYGAYKGDICYAIAIWTSPIARAWNDKPYLELRRFAISKEAPYNTASYLLGKMIKNIRFKFPMIERLISYQDEENHIGTIYKASNWTDDGLAQKSVWNIGRDRKEPVIKSRKRRWIYNL